MRNINTSIKKSEEIGPSVKRLMTHPFFINEERKNVRDKEEAVRKICEILKKPYEERVKDIMNFMNLYTRLDKAYGTNPRLFGIGFFNRNYIMR
ncbi:MAG TPA: hypothetical protein ENG87_04650 [Candidatus Pacearchaeota archaeon]|nr:hypothetical protein BMS3Abin17_00348 [archaeon BMS3Abin17]HDK42646.1 hypothetical protein [Candidatus Pacearchaeota archaeon]HDZ60858.1 hypothetical protein [Candidatus Pacearchaeota archaeon]